MTLQRKPRSHPIYVPANNESRLSNKNRSVSSRMILGEGKKSYLGVW